MARALLSGRPKVRDIAINAFFDNFTMAALFGRLCIPGSQIGIIDRQHFPGIETQEPAK
jgi:hypothetical protein